MKKKIFENIKKSIGNYTLYFLSIYTTVISVMLHKTISTGVYQIENIFLDCFLPLFFIYILYFVITIINYKSVNISFWSIFLKSSLFTLIPLILTIVSSLNINNAKWDLSITTVLWVFLCNLFFTSLILLSTHALKLKALIILGLFILSPWFSNIIETKILRYSPFEIIITVLKALKEDQTANLSFGILSVYTLIMILLVIKYNKQHEKKH